MMHATHFFQIDVFLQSTMGKRLSNRWNNMCPEERALYDELEKAHNQD